ncbi:alpha/beta fold hydrolase [Falsiroseomonas sp. HW251]|uniref:alpha/beta fold hydrolase n=1 Tax=Falsiroseomonas sp. HW251 TaxID=3390998 RepID=UPI003D31E0C5
MDRQEQALAIALGSAALLGGLALQANADARRVERENPPRGRFVRGAGARLHVLDRGFGDATPVVLLHGNAVRAEDWIASRVLPQLAPTRRVLAFDRPGFGFSDRPRDRIWGAVEQADAIAEALHRLDVPEAVIVTHSWGSLAGIALALRHPQAVAGLVLIAGYHYPTARADVAIFSPPAVPVIGDVLRYTAAPLIGRAIAPGMVKAMFSPLPVPARFEAAIPRAMMLRPGQIRASAEDAATMVARARVAKRRYGDLAARKVAILAGTDDRIVDPGRHSVRLHHDIPGSTLRLLPGIGHMLHWAAPELVVEAVNEVSGTPTAPLIGAPAGLETDQGREAAPPGSEQPSPAQRV